MNKIQRIVFGTNYSLNTKVIFDPFMNDVLIRMKKQNFWEPPQTKK